MFDVLFGWRKASKCKKVIKLAQCRLKLLKNKRHVIVKQLRQDTAHLIKTGYQNIAFNRAEQLIQDETVMAAYDLLDRFCDFILSNFSHIRKLKECPIDINEAVSSLVYASARCGDLPELRVIRTLFEDRYGKKFATAAVELLPGNLVNRQVQVTLSMKPVSDEMKQKTVNEIAEDYCLQKPEVLALEYYTEWQQNQPVKESSEHKVLDKDVETSNAEIQEQIVLVGSSSTMTNFSSEPPSTSASDTFSTDQQALPTVSESTLRNEAEKVEISVGADSQSISSAGTEESKEVVITANTHEAKTALESKEERSIRGSSSESLPKLCDEKIVYLDDIEEHQSSTPKDEDSQDQRSFKFKSPRVSKGVNLENSCDPSYWERHESWTENSSSKGSQRSHIESRKRSRRRSVYHENQSVKDMEYSSYYDQPQKRNFNHKHRSHQPRKQHSKMSVEEGEERSSYDAERRQKQFCSREIKVTPLASNRRYYPQRPCCRCCCNHEIPCHFSTDEDVNESEVLPPKQKNLIRRRSCEMNRAALMPPKPRRRSCDNEAMVYGDFTHLDHPIHKRNNGVKAAPVELASQGGRASIGACGARQDSATPPYLRSATMPPERSKDSSKDDFQRLNSCPVPYPTHVHPRLPDYDDLAATFVALKKEKMMNKQQYCIEQ